MSRPVRTRLDVVVPAYFHPAAAADAWQQLVRLGPALRLVVVNVHNGPGAGPDPGYREVVAALQAARIRLVGYVDTDYGRRPDADVAADVAAYLRWYELDGIFFDQVSAQLADLDHYAQQVLAARAAGARQVVLNPGTHPHPGYVDLANLTATFEGPWVDYQALRPPDWVHRHRPRVLPSGPFRPDQRPRPRRRPRRHPAREQRLPHRRPRRQPLGLGVPQDSAAAPRRARGRSAIARHLRTLSRIR